MGVRTRLGRSSRLKVNTCINQNRLQAVFCPTLLFPCAAGNADVFLWVSRAKLLKNTGHIDHTLFAI